MTNYTSRYSDRIEQLENEIKEKQEELEYCHSETTIANLEEEIYNTCLLYTSDAADD